MKHYHDNQEQSYCLAEEKSSLDSSAAVVQLLYPHIFFFIRDKVLSSL